MPEPVLVGQGRRPAIRRPWPALPRWFVVGSVVGLVAFVAVVVVAIVAMVTFQEQPLFERRSAPAGNLSHDVGRVTLPDAPYTEVTCNGVTGWRVQGGTDTTALLSGAFGGLCKRLGALGPYSAPLGDRIVALAKQRAVLSFANFGRTGELTTTLVGSPPRILLSDAFLRGGGQFKGFLLPELAHEIWHGGTATVTARAELDARKVEARACALIPSKTAFRGCTEAQRIVAYGDDVALAKLEAAGYPR